MNNSYGKYIQSILLSSVLLSGILQGEELHQDNIYNLNFQGLENVRASSGDSLKSISADHAPASFTNITCQMIQEFEARSLDELLEIYTPL